MNELDQARYISLTTYKKSGDGVPSPVWITGTGGTYTFITGHQSWKVKRLHNNASVEVCVSDFRGKVKPGAPKFNGTGSVSSTAASITAAQSALTAKYGWQFKLTKVADAVRKKLGVGTDQDSVVVTLSLRPAA